MKTKLLDYYKMILQKVSFDASLFVKEYQKAVKSLQSNDEIWSFGELVERNRASYNGSPITG